jgi:hypothetical protein
VVVVVVVVVVSEYRRVSNPGPWLVFPWTKHYFKYVSLLLMVTLELNIKTCMIITSPLYRFLL